MAPPVTVQSRAHLDRLIRYNERLVVRCLLRNGDDDELAFREVAVGFEEVVCCYLDPTRHRELASSVVDDVGEADAVACWLFYRDGTKVCRQDRLWVQVDVDCWVAEGWFAARPASTKRVIPSRGWAGLVH